MTIAARLLLLTALLGLAGCQYNPFRPEPPPPPPAAGPAQSLEELLAWQVAVLRMDDEQLRRRLAQPGEALGGGCDAPRLRRAMLMEALRAGEARLRSLLRPCLDQATPDAWALLGENLWLRHQRLQNREMAADRQLSAARSELAATRARAEELRRQLDGLKAIERSLQQRD
ncbi:hypothetical protein [Alkalilimnicola sp. S0819]|uniref:hypothetical protein n=1 Tax=Alkalilimnicola sp. S0819 TaxID=2613922 RepID=UPI0012617B56|nr:hypothetical protein [Alkalilimnicola sp. S0819]KAB7628287.1 hypothetical protein F3N43_00850 [Alkalilimnicola sp. S0819]MPQ15184.1 hypothetical protein [Alkalilimnicola sp. S0819]